MNQKFFHICKTKERLRSLLQKNGPLKFEDKNLLILGTFVLINVLAFIYFANSFFNQPPSLFDERNTIKSEEFQHKFDKIFQDTKADFEKGFQNLDEAFEEKYSPYTGVPSEEERNIKANTQKTKNVSK